MARFGYDTYIPIEAITGSATNYFDPAGGSNETVLSSRHLLCFYFSSLHAIPTAYAQDQTGAAGPDKIKAVLLRPAGWEVNHFGPSSSGQSEFIYETRGEKVVVKIQNLSRSDGGNLLNWQREVMITSDTIKHDGCRDVGIILRFDPNDQDYPIKAKSLGNYEYKFKAK